MYCVHFGGCVNGESLSCARLVRRATRAPIIISDPVYADELLAHAQQLFEFAEKYPGKYSQSITDANGYYRFEFFFLLQVDLGIWSKFCINPVLSFSELVCTVYYVSMQKLDEVMFYTDIETYVSAQTVL